MEKIRLQRSTGILALLASILLIAGFMGLKITFGYPGIIREEFSSILIHLYNRRHIVPLLFYIIGMSGFLITFVSVLIGNVFDNYQKNVFTELGRISGIVYGVLLFTGILRYTKLFPYLADAYVNHKASETAIEVVFASFNEYIGFSVTEHVGYMFLTAMIFFFTLAMIRVKIFKPWMRHFGILTSIGLMIGNLEFFGFSQLFTVNRVFSALAGLWLMVLGINLIVKHSSCERQNSLFRDIKQ